MPKLPISFRSSSEKRFAGASDSELISACLKGNASAWDALIGRYAALIYSLSLRMGLSQSDAEDIFQDICVTLLNHLGDLRNTERLSSWLISTTKREIWRMQRRRGAKLTSELKEGEWEMENAPSVHAQEAASPEADVVALEEQQLVREGLAQLAERCRRLLTLLYVDDPPASYTEVSEVLGLPVGSIGPTRARCLQNLRKLLDQLGY